MDMVNVTINGKNLVVQAGATILEAAKQLKIHIPTLCYLDLGDLKMVNKVASCRICVVEVEGSETDFIFTVESWGQLEPREMVKEAIKIFTKKLDDFQEKVKTLK